MHETGSDNITRSTEIPIVDLNLKAEWVCYEATAIVNVGETGAHLLIPTTRKRRRPIVIEASSELLHQLLRLRDELPVVEDFAADREFLRQKYRELSECNGKQVNQIACRDLDIGRLKKDLVARTDQLEDAERRLRELQDAYVARGEQLNTLRTNFKHETLAVRSLKFHCEQMAAAIRVIINPPDLDAEWKKAFLGIRHALTFEGCHERSVHPWWSRDYWFGCENCVPDWQLQEPEFLSYKEAKAAEGIVAAVYRRVSEVLRPALTGDKSEKNEKGD